jgi:prefoldin subunit 5
MGSDASFQLWSLLALDSPQAIILLMLGAGVWVFAALKGYSGFDDPYPDYGKMDRAAQEASDALSDFRNAARRDLEEPLDAAKAALAGRLEKMRAEYEAMNKAFDQAAVKMQALDAKARALDEAAAGAVYLYRQENAAARTTPAPAYLGSPPPAAGPALDALADAAAMIDEARAKLADAQAQSARALEDLLSELDAATNRHSGGQA